MVYSQPCVSTDCGRAFRVTLRKASPNIQNKSKRGVRIVPAFTVQALQCGTKVKPPPRCNPFAPSPPRPSQFRVCYLRGEFPISIEFSQGGRQIGWKAPLEKLDYHHYLPMFFEGLAESRYPYYFFVQEGIRDMVKKCPYKVLPVVPQLIIPIKGALNTKRLDVMCNTLKSIQMLVISCERVGEALVPYYRQILPILNLFKEHNCNIGDGIDHTATKRSNVGDLIQETLQMLERYGGVDAFINIKYMVPTYESCLLN